MGRVDVVQREPKKKKREIVEARVSNWVQHDGTRWALLDMHLRIDSGWTLREKEAAPFVDSFVG